MALAIIWRNFGSLASPPPDTDVDVGIEIRFHAEGHVGAEFAGFPPGGRNGSRVLTKGPACMAFGVLKATTTRLLRSALGPGLVEKWVIGP